MDDRLLSTISESYDGAQMSLLSDLLKLWSASAIMAWRSQRYMAYLRAYCPLPPVGRLGRGFCAIAT